MSKQYHNTHSHPGLTIFCLIMTLIILAGCTLGGLQLWAPDGKNLKPSEWFQKDEETEPAPKDPAEETPVPENGGLMLPETAEGNGIALMSTAIPVSQYAAYGVSPASEGAQTVTATVLPDNDASNTAVTWTAEWEDPASEWATGKDIRQYFSLSYGEDYKSSKTCTVTCLQAFGEPATLKVAAVEDETKSATCKMDYLQQLKSVSVNIGNIPVNLGGNTDVTIRIRTDEGGAGGAVTVTKTMSDDAYTIENEYTESASLTHQINEGGDKQSKWLALTNGYSVGSGSVTVVYNDEDTLLGKSIYFDRRLFTQYKFYGGNPGFVNGEEPEYHNAFHQDRIEYLADQFEISTNFGGPYKNKVIWTLTLTLTSTKKESSFTYTSDIVWAAIDESVTVTDVWMGGTEHSSDIIFP